MYFRRASLGAVIRKAYLGDCDLQNANILPAVLLDPPGRNVDKRPIMSYARTLISLENSIFSAVLPIAHHCSHVLPTDDVVKMIGMPYPLRLRRRCKNHSRKGASGNLFSSISINCNDSLAGVKSVGLVGLGGRHQVNARNHGNVFTFESRFCAICGNSGKAQNSRSFYEHEHDAT